MVWYVILSSVTGVSRLSGSSRSCRQGSRHPGMTGRQQPVRFARKSPPVASDMEPLTSTMESGATVAGSPAFADDGFRGGGSALTRQVVLEPIGGFTGGRPITGAFSGGIHRLSNGAIRF